MVKTAFTEAIFIIESIEKYNHQAYFVGGCVRDFILGRSIHDIDIATSAPPKLVCTIFDSVIPVGIEHGTVIVRHVNKSYEVTTFRLDGKYSDRRHPDNVQFITTLEEDLKRRDFTINALAMRKDGQIIDVVNGTKDLTRKVIRTVGNGLDRFNEDPLRIIRALRFVSQLGFSLDRDTISYMERVKPAIDQLAVERITNEFQKFFTGSFVNKGMYDLIDLKIYNHLPIFKDHASLVRKLPKHLIPFSSFGQVIAFFHKLDEQIPVAKWIKAWKCSNKVKKEANQLVEALTYLQQNGLDEWLVYQLPYNYSDRFTHLVQILYPEMTIKKVHLEAIRNHLPIHSIRELAIKGADLIQLFPTLPKGPWVHQSLQQLEKQVVCCQLENNYRKLKEWIICHPPEIN